MDKNIIISQDQLEERIYTIRGKQVMIDYHLAELYELETKRLNEQVKRNSNRFPESFMFQLTNIELNSLRSQIATAKRRTLPYVFTEQGIAMLSAVLNSNIAVKVSIQIMNAFVNMRHFVLKNALISQRLEKIELKQNETDQKFEQIFKALESSFIPTQGVFFEGQVFDAYELTSKIIRTAKKSILLIDNYIDESTLVHLSKKNKDVKVQLLTKNSSKQLLLDVKKANEQYGNFEIQIFDKSHDRFLIIDGVEVYHLGASLKDLGKKWFAFSKMDKSWVENILNLIENK
jgi:ORF6N domain